jgi:alpha-L-arabinofuranosidase
VSATRHQSDGRIAVFVVNHLPEAQTRGLDLSELGRLEDGAEVWTLAGPSLDAVNSFQEKERVAPRENRVEIEGSEVALQFPAYSVTALSFKPAGG